MEHDASDILGHTGLPVAHGKNSGPISFSMGQWIFIGVVLFVVYIVAKRLWKRALVWQEQSYKLATRRRHGIPDSDLRPFNVAYSAAMTRAREEESRAHVKSNPLLHLQGRSLDRHNTQPEQTLRNRIGAHPETITVPGPMALKPTPSSYSSAANPESTKFMNHYAPRQPITHSAQASSSTAPARSSTCQPVHHHLEGLTSDNEGKKRSLDEQEDDEHEFKKSRLDGEEFIDGDEDAEFYEAGDTAPKRGSKRVFGEEEEIEVSETKKFRGKRARKVSQEKTRQSHAEDDNMDIDDEELDEITELKSRAGKKRDRAEAGSTFGGDDDSAVELDAEDDIKARRRRRKRRTVVKRKSEGSDTRGKKRDRDSDDERCDQESEDASQGKVSRKKRGKRGSDRHDKDHVSRSDISVDESNTSVRGKVRVIGEEWESNGIKYKVGLNGQRLRQTLVKQARQKFIMPIDSQHPDRNANVQICLECWLTEGEYQEKKAEHMLAWQDGTPPRQEDPLNNLSLDITGSQLSQSVPGKNLLWGSSTASTPAASPPSRSPTETPPESTKPKSYRDSYRHSIATNVGLPISPFHNSQIPVKRIASTSRASLSVLNGPAGLPDSTKGNSRTANKSFSKWEKQELEAQAIMKMREANRKKELEREAKLKEEREQAERAAAERARLEKERLDRERVEKERIEKEKAEVERKAKESAQVPKITVTAPSSESVTAPSTSISTNLPNFFSKAPTGSTTTSKPTGNTASSGPTSNSFFSNASASASIPTSSFTQAEPSKPQSPFNFSAPTGNSNTNNTVTSSSAFKSGAFPFSATTTPSSGAPKTEGSTQSPFGSLSSRTGTQAPAPVPETSNPSPAQPTLQPSIFGTFSVPKPNNSMNTNHSMTPSAQPNPSATSSSTTAPLKFTFNVPSKSATPNPPPVTTSTTALPSASSSSLTGALGSDQQKTTSGTSTFNFKIPTTPASVSTPTNMTSTIPNAATISTPKFTFGTGTGSSPFGGNTTTSAPSANTGNNTTTTPKFLFPVNNTTSTPAATTTTTTANSTSAPGSGAFTFSFGQTPVATTTPQASPFGPSAFGKTAAAGTSSSNTTTKPSIFGGSAFGASQQS